MTSTPLASLFFIPFIISLLGLIIGLIKPSLIKIKSRKSALLILGGATLLFFILIGIFAPPVPSQNIKPKVNQENKENAPEISETNPKVENETNSSNTIPINSTTTNNIDPVITENKTISIVQTTILYSVVKVVDGDTIDVNINGKRETLRLIGINTPEVVDPRKPVECFGKEASAKAKELLTGKKVSLEADSTQGELDKYQRLLRYVFLEDGTNFNLYMIKEGYAYEYTYNAPYKYQTEFKAAQKLAQDNQKGLWSPNTCNGNSTLTTVTPTSSQTTTIDSSSTKYYTSSYYTSKYYYPASCQAWQSLSSSYLKAFDSLEDLLASYPSRILSPQCQ